MTNRGKYLLYSILDFALTFGGAAGVIVYNYITPDTSTGYKLSFTGIVLLIALILVGKAQFEKKYQAKENELLQSLAVATDTSVKEELTNQIDKHHEQNAIYNRIVMVMPFIIITIVCYLSVDVLEELATSCELIVATMGAGSVFNIIKKPLASKAAIEKAQKKIIKKKRKEE